MKILKPGKVEMRKFVCEQCGCTFVANEYEHEPFWVVNVVTCPTCCARIDWNDGEPYEEPVQGSNQPVRDRLARLIANAPVGAHAATDAAFLQVADYLLQNGVTFREGK